ncbi:unnamed protein product [Protopolystoma xenopodis]|uniref:Uncharacterized protein n=1 Tax=Protopolystoma xenopodis TaxID=117903 RepID=A0A448X5U2_9PLAT|nr:unnamed protein product [Protopolystoma xenopodis]
MRLYETWRRIWLDTDKPTRGAKKYYGFNAEAGPDNLKAKSFPPAKWPVGIQKSAEKWRDERAFVGIINQALSDVDKFASREPGCKREEQQ